jgi:uncharacterized pyridoxamine 5'-phosphate oxidase family protein
MKEVCEYLKNAGTFYLATVEGDQPRVRPFGVVAIYEEKLYFQTGKKKSVYQQLKKNPKIEISGMADDSSWIRVQATAVEDDRLEARQYFLDKNPMLKGMYAADDGNCVVFYLKEATATFSSFSSEPRAIRF